MEKGQIDIRKYDKLPTFIAVEGPIGAGKTTLTKLLADSFSCLLYTSPSPRDRTRSRMPSSA